MFQQVEEETQVVVELNEARTNDSEYEEDAHYDEYDDDGDAYEGGDEDEESADSAPAPSASFSTFGASFQEQIVHVLLHDRQWAGEVVELMNPMMFDTEHLRVATRILWKFHAKYRAFPTMKTFYANLRESLDDLDEVTRSRIVAFVERCIPAPDPADSAYIKDRVTTFCVNYRFREALLKSVELLNSGGGNYEQIINTMRKAVANTESGDLGHDFYNDRSARWIEIDRNPIPTGVPELDENTNGGIGPGELAVVIAPTGVGKSHWLVQVGAAAMMSGLNVVHYALEMGFKDTGRRYDSHFTGIDSNDIISRKDDVDEFYRANPDLGHLTIKTYFTGQATVTMIRSHIERLRLNGVFPDLLIIDYADIMRSVANHEGERHRQKAVYEELRGLAQELNLPIWTASQSNREGAKSEIVTIENMSESYGKAHTVDLAVALSQKQSERSEGIARLFISKNRFGPTGLVLNVRVNTAQSRFQTTGEVESYLEAKASDKAIKDKSIQSALDSMRSKWAKAKKVVDSLEPVVVTENSHQGE